MNSQAPVDLQNILELLFKKSVETHSEVHIDILEYNTRISICPLKIDTLSDHSLEERTIQAVDTSSNNAPRGWTVQKLTLRISEIFQDIGIVPYSKGYKYLTDAIIMVVQDESVLKNICNIVYSTVAQKNGTTQRRAERAMRHILDVSWGNCSPDVAEKYFGHTISASKKRPVLSVFIATIAHELILEQLPSAL